MLSKSGVFSVSVVELQKKVSVCVGVVSELRYSFEMDNSFSEPLVPKD